MEEWCRRSRLGHQADINLVAWIMMWLLCISEPCSHCKNVYPGNVTVIKQMGESFMKAFIQWRVMCNFIIAEVKSQPWRQMKMQINMFASSLTCISVTFIENKSDVGMEISVKWQKKKKKEQNFISDGTWSRQSSSEEVCMIDTRHNFLCFFFFYVSWM